jgi:hypothetical protein
MGAVERLDELLLFSPEEAQMHDAEITQIWEGTNRIRGQIIGRSFIVKR